eukprot:TRINITY_DN37009_c0_g1_i1.p1 TRINITY_DN37009_c0_g1~~TRINITY_DN37009_c0_g1_i1.p1  ORF type:complete len:152 (-),score=6.40 TRINITY_DN37009_c0_g1_i1:184-639(-)
MGDTEDPKTREVYGVVNSKYNQNKDDAEEISPQLYLSYMAHKHPWFYWRYFLAPCTLPHTRGEKICLMVCWPLLLILCILLFVCQVFNYIVCIPCGCIGFALDDDTSCRRWFTCPMYHLFFSFPLRFTQGYGVVSSRMEQELAKGKVPPTV